MIVEGLRERRWRRKLSRLREQGPSIATGFLRRILLTRGWRAYRLRRLMSSELPLRIDPRRLAEQRACLRGTLLLARMKRLGGLMIKSDGLTASEDIVHVSLHFGRNAGGLTVIAGEISARLEMECQRCLSPYMQLIDRRFELVLAQSEAEAERLLAEYEVLEAGDPYVFTQDLIEDELLLSMPLIPAHADAGLCERAAPAGPAVDTKIVNAAGDAPPARNPFSVLKDLKAS